MQKIQLGNILLQRSRNPQSLAYEIKYKVFWNILQVACNNYTKVFKCRSWVGTPTLSRLFLFLVICLICVWSVYFFLVTFSALYKFNRDMFQVLGPRILNGLLSCLFVRLLRGSELPGDRPALRSSWQALPGWKPERNSLQSSNFSSTSFQNSPNIINSNRHISGRQIYTSTAEIHSPLYGPPHFRFRLNWIKKHLEQKCSSQPHVLEVLDYKRKNTRLFSNSIIVWTTQRIPPLLLMQQRILISKPQAM